MAIFLCCVLGLEALLIAVAPRFHSGSVLRIARDCVLLRVGFDSWYYMQQGYVAWHQHANALYETVFFQRGIRFIYPPTSLLLFHAWRSVGSALHIAPFTVLRATMVVSLLGTCVVAGEFLLEMLRRRWMLPIDGAARWQARGLTWLLVPLFLPLINAFRVGQVQTILNFLLMLSAYLWMRGKRVSPAIAIGVCCWLKPPMGLFVVWGAVRRQWGFTAALLATLAAGLTASLVVFGWHNTTEYLTLLRYLSRHGDALATNQSLNGLLHRVMHVGNPVTWVHGYPPYNSTIYWATLLFSALLLGMALAIPMLRRRDGTVVDFLIFAMATTMASPIAWEHHYGIFFLVVLVWMPRAAQRWSTFAALLGTYALMTDTWAPLTPLMNSRWTFLISHIFFGGFILFCWTVLTRSELTPEDRYF